MPTKLINVYPYVIPSFKTNDLISTQEVRIRLLFIFFFNHIFFFSINVSFLFHPHVPILLNCFNSSLKPQYKCCFLTPPRQSPSPCHTLPGHPTCLPNSNRTCSDSFRGISFTRSQISHSQGHSFTIICSVDGKYINFYSKLFSSKKFLFKKF